MEKRVWFQTNPTCLLSLMNPFDGSKIETPTETYILYQEDIRHPPLFKQTFCFYWVFES